MCLVRHMRGTASELGLSFIKVNASHRKCVQYWPSAVAIRRNLASSYDSFLYCYNACHLALPRFRARALHKQTYNNHDFIRNLFSWNCFQPVSNQTMPSFLYLKGTESFFILFPWSFQLQKIVLHTTFSAQFLAFTTFNFWHSILFNLRM